MTIGKKIKNRRTQLGLSVTEVASRAGVSAASLYRYENGSVVNVPASILIPLADVLRTSVSWLLGESNQAGLPGDASASAARGRPRAGGSVRRTGKGVPARAVVIASFGTRWPEGEKDIDAVEAALREQAGEVPCVRAYTSSVVRRILARDGRDIPDVAGALEQLAGRGVKQVFIQPTHLLPGVEYDLLAGQAAEMETFFQSLSVGRPLLDDTESLCALAGALCAAYPFRAGRAVLFMGHGTGHFSNIIYPALQTALRLSGRDELFVATVEGWPAVDDWMDTLAGRPVDLVPLMLVAGDHAVNDMAGSSADSWKSRLEELGCDVRCVMTGLGREPRVQALYRERLRDLLNTNGSFTEKGKAYGHLSYID